MQPTASAVGLRQQRQSPNGAKDSATYVGQHPLGLVSVAPFGHTRCWDCFPRLTPWATLFPRFAASRQATSEAVPFHFRIGSFSED
jgi:hypothetical protein